MEFSQSQTQILFKYMKIQLIRTAWSDAATPAFPWKEVDAMRC